MQLPLAFVGALGSGGVTERLGGVVEPLQMQLLLARDMPPADTFTSPASACRTPWIVFALQLVAATPPVQLYEAGSMLAYRAPSLTTVARSFVVWSVSPKPMSPTVRRRTSGKQRANSTIAWPRRPETLVRRAATTGLRPRRAGLAILCIYCARLPAEAVLFTRV